MSKKITVALMRDLERQVAEEKISYSRMVEILNESILKTFSKDYSALYNFLISNPEKPVLCFVNYDKKLDGSFFRDPAHIRYFKERFGRFCIGARGIGYEPIRLFGNSEEISESVFCEALKIIDLEYVQSMIYERN